MRAPFSSGARGESRIQASKGHGARRRSGAAAAAVLLEAVEPRLLFATILVTTAADTANVSDGVTSLREALAQAAAVSGPDMITFDAAAQGTIVLDPALGSLVIDSDVEIDGPAGGGASVVLKRDSSAGTNFRILRVDAGHVVTLSRLTITGGAAPDTDGGGGILNRGNLTVADCLISNNTAPDTEEGHGGGITNDAGGTLTVLRCTVLNNTAGSLPTGGIIPAIGRGGGIYSLGALTVTSSDITGNRAHATLADGGGIAAEAGSLTVTDSNFANNTVEGAGNGGGIGAGLYAGVSFTLTGGTFSGNSAAGFLAEGGGAYVAVPVGTPAGQVTGTTFSNNTLTGAGSEGAGLANQGPLMLTRVTVSGNTMPSGVGAGIANIDTGVLTLAESRVQGNSLFGSGGGVANYGDLTVVDSTIVSNAANSGAFGTPTGGGIWNVKTLTVIRTTFQSNSASQGGGIDNQSAGTAHLYDVTFAANSAGSGGGVVNAGTLTSVNCTFSANRATAAGGVGGALYRTAGTVTLHNTLAAGNVQGTGASSLPDDVAGSIDPASSHNLIGNGDRVDGILSGLNGNAMGTAAAPIDPKLGPLAGNGGLTQTYALLAGSPALNLGDNARAVDTNGAPLATDQRGAGFPRNFDTTVDIGAYELQANSPLPRPHDVTAAPDSVSGSVFVDWAGQPEPDFAYFNVYRATSPAGPFLALADHLTANEFADQTAAPGTTYYYTVTDVDTAGTESPQSLPSFWRGGLQLIVSTALDENDGNYSPGHLSLREALRLTATQGNPGQVITFAPALANQPIQLSDPLGTMTLSRGVQVQGLGGGQTVLNTSGKFRVFLVDAGNTAALSGLDIVGPDPANPVSGTGGGVTNNGTLTLTDCSIRGFYTNGVLSGGSGGAAIQNTGSLTMTGGTLEHDRSAGGAIYSNGSIATVTLTGVIASNCSGAPGGALYLNGGSLTLTNCSLQNNQSSSDGGAIYAVSVTLRATDCQFAGNTAAGSSNGGGAIFASSGTLTLSGCTFSNNAAPACHGGAIYLQGSNPTVVGNACTFAGNSAGITGGAIHGQFATLKLVGCTLSGNSAVAGAGAFYVLSAKAINLSNCTLSGNSTAGSAGAVELTEPPSFATVFSNVTVTGNRCDSDGDGQGTGGGIVRFSSGSVDLENSIVAGNLRGAAGPGGAGGTPDDLSGSFLGRSNLIGAGDGSTGLTNGSFGNQIGTAAAPIDPKLGPLANNGGPTLTHALLPGSPALNAGDGTRIAADTQDLDGDGNTTEPVPFDQRGAGFARVVGTAVDIGALEYVPAPPAAPSGVTASVRADGTVDLAWTDGSADETEFRVERSNDPGFAAIDQTFVLPANATAYHEVSTVGGTYYYRVRAANAGGDSAASNVAGVLVPVAGVSSGAGARFNLSGLPGAPLLSVNAGTVTLTNDLSKTYAGISLGVSGGSTVLFGVDQNFVNVSLSGGGTISLDAPPPPGGTGGSNSGTPTPTPTPTPAPTPVTPPASGPEVLVASSAGYVRDGAYANTDLSRDGSLVVKKGPRGQDRETYLTFDLSKVNGTIHSARLRLVGRLSQSAVRGVTVRAYAVNGTQPKGALKWNNRPQANASALAAAVVFGTARHSYEWDLTTWLIAQRAAGRHTATIALKGAAVTDAAALFDTARATATAPRLIVT